MDAHKGHLTELVIKKEATKSSTFRITPWRPVPLVPLLGSSGEVHFSPGFYALFGHLWGGKWWEGRHAWQTGLGCAEGPLKLGPLPLGWGLCPALRTMRLVHGGWALFIVGARLVLALLKAARDGE